MMNPKTTKLFLVACAVACACAADDPAWLGKIRRDHPRMFFNAETWPAVKARMEGSAKAEYESMLRRCESYPTNPVCTGMEMPAKLAETPTATPIPDVKEWGRQAAECALVWRVTRRPEFLEKAKAMMRVSGPAWRKAYANGRAVSWYSYTRIFGLCAYDWTFEALTPAERAELLRPMVEHADEVQWRKGGRYILRRNDGGHQTGYYGVPPLKWYAGLAALGDGVCDDLARSLIVRGHDDMLKMLAYRQNSAGDDGPLSTGTLGYAIGEYPWAHFNFFHTWTSATGENLAGEYPGIGLFPNYIWWQWIPVAGKRNMAHEFGFGDTRHEHAFMGLDNLYQHMVQYERFFRDSDPAAARLAATLADRAPNRTLGTTWFFYPFLFDADLKSQPFSDAELVAFPAKARHFESAGQFVMRSGWTADDTFALFTAGAKLTQHKHYDECNFVIYKHSFLALDTGSRAYQDDYNLTHYYAQTVAHNCVLVHKPGEPLPGYWGTRSKDPSAQFNYGGQVYGKMAKVLAFSTNPLFSYVAADAAPAYGAKCEQAVRQFVHLQPDFFVVYDRVVAADASYKKEWLLHVEEEPTLGDGLMSATCGGGKIFCQTFLPRGAKLEAVGGPGKEFWANGRNWELNKDFVRAARKRCAAWKCGGPYFGQWRLEVSPPAPSREDRFLHVVTAADPSVAAPVDARFAEERGMEGVVVSVPNYSVGGKKGTLVAKILFRSSGEVGGEVNAELRDDLGRIVSAGSRPLDCVVTPQAGVFPGKNPQ